MLVENNTIKNNPNNGVLGFEYPDLFPPESNPSAKTIFFQVSGNRISSNRFVHNGYNESPLLSGSPFTGDLSLLSDYAVYFGGPVSTSDNNCVSGNSFADATFPTNIEGTWGCQNKTTPNPGGGLPAGEYLLTLEQEEKYIKESVIPREGQPAPPATKTPTMPNPCEGVPKNPLCPKGNIK